MHLKYINNQDVSQAKYMWLKWINYTDHKLSQFYSEMQPKKWTEWNLF